MTEHRSITRGAIEFIVNEWVRQVEGFSEIYHSNHAVMDAAI